MGIRTECSRAMLCCIMMLVPAIALAQAGPPFQTDDPVPVDYGHYEFYVFGSAAGTPGEFDWLGPAFEFNWGALPRLQWHVIVPFGGIDPTDAPAGTSHSAFGLTDMELGAKIAWIKETKYFPQIGSFTMFEMPTGSASRGLGLGHVSYRLPFWAYKKLGSWGLDGGAGYAVAPHTEQRSYFYGGFLVQRTMNQRLDLAVEVFSHAREGVVADQTRASTLIDAGGAYHFKSPGLQLLFAFGHSVAGQAESYAYLGLYKTWGNDQGAGNKTAADAMRSARLAPPTSE